MRCQCCALLFIPSCLCTRRLIGRPANTVSTRVWCIPDEVFQPSFWESSQTSPTHFPKRRASTSAFRDCVLFFEARAQITEVRGSAGVCPFGGCPEILNRPRNCLTQLASSA